MNNVVVYSAPWCAGCKVIKQALTRAEVQFQEVDITTQEGGISAKELGIRSIPVTFVTGVIEPFIGSKPETINKLLEAIGD